MRLRNLDKSILADLQERTGAKAVAVILSDSTMPCADHLAGEECAEEHQFEVFTAGISSKGALGQMFNIAWQLTDDNGNVQE